jgi:hypothetical protein
VVTLEKNAELLWGYKYAFYSRGGLVAEGTQKEIELIVSDQLNFQNSSIAAG